ncbi:MAG: hypothetical protein H0X63_09075, partial [Flavobacteriales bacterium]|nr:hypothetical protein [Flavobacteriales bacterium]
AGFFGNLSTGLRQNGYNVTEAYFTDHIFQYSANQKNYSKLFSITRYFRNKFYSRSQTEKFPRFLYFLIFQISLHLFFFQSVLKHNVFIFGFGISIFENGKDLKWLKRMGKTVISVVALGSEARPPYIDGARRKPDGSWDSIDEIIRLSCEMKKKLEGIERYSSIVVGAPLTSQFLEKPFVNLFELGLPYPKFKSEITEQRKSKTDRQLKILHSPSNLLAKGTIKIREALDSLKRKGYNFDYFELTNSPNKVVLEAIASCDFVVDQVYSDTAMATFATEAAFLGKPAIVGGYGWDELKKFVKAEKFPASYICKPETLETAIEELIVNEQFRNDLGKSAYKFVHDNWEAKKVGKKFSLLIEGEMPNDWILDPYEIIYTQGIGLSESELKKMIESVIKIGGEKALSLDNKPRLKEAFLKLIHSKASKDNLESTV